MAWAEVGRPAHAAMLDWYRQLVTLRRTRPELSDPRLDSTSVDVDVDLSTLVISRGRIRLFVNLGDAERCWPSPDPSSLLAASDPNVRRDGAGVVVPPDAVAILQTSDA